MEEVDKTIKKQMLQIKLQMLDEEDEQETEGLMKRYLELKKRLDRAKSQEEKTEDIRIDPPRARVADTANLQHLKHQSEQLSSQILKADNEEQIQKLMAELAIVQEQITDIRKERETIKKFSAHDEVIEWWESIGVNGQLEVLNEIIEAADLKKNGWQMGFCKALMDKVRSKLPISPQDITRIRRMKG